LGVEDEGDMTLKGPSGVRGPSGLLNEEALDHLVERTHATVHSIRDRGRIPLMVGGDCPVLLGALASIGPGTGPGLVMLDGHEDAWPPSLSETGEASDSELGIALGLISDLSPTLAAWTPLVAGPRVALLGPRDSDEIAKRGGTPVAPHVALFLDDRSVTARGPERSAVEALERSGKVSSGCTSTSMFSPRRTSPRPITFSPVALAGPSSRSSPPRFWPAPGRRASASPSTTRIGTQDGPWRGGSWTSSFAWSRSSRPKDRLDRPAVETWRSVRGQEHADGLLRAAVALVVAESPPCVEHRAVDRDREHEPVEPGRALRHSPEPREPADLGKHNPPKGEQSRLTSDTDQRSSEAEQRAFEIVRLFELDDSLIEGIADRTTVSVNSCSRTEGRALGAALRLLSWTSGRSTASASAHPRLPQRLR
jgi:Arginase family